MRFSVTSFFNSTLLPATRDDAEGWEPPGGRLVWHTRYQEGDRLVESRHTITHEGAAGDFQAACDKAFALLNADDRPNHDERSLSVGDVVRVQDEAGRVAWYACQDLGWRLIQDP